MYLGLPPPSTHPSSNFLSSSTVCSSARFACLVSYRRHPWDSKSVAVSVVDFIWNDAIPEGLAPSCDDVIGSRDAIVDCSVFDDSRNVNPTSELIPRLPRNVTPPHRHTQGMSVWRLTVAELPCEVAADPTRRWQPSSHTRQTAFNQANDSKDAIADCSQL